MRSPLSILAGTPCGPAVTCVAADRLASSGRVFERHYTQEPPPQQEVPSMECHTCIATSLLIIAVATVSAGHAEDTVTLSAGGKPVVEYRQTPNPNKVYVSKLYSPSGVQVLLDSPADHVHHHALMLGLDVEGVSFWIDGKQQGTQRPRGPARVTPDALEQTIDWVTPSNRVLLVEERKITTHPVEGNGYTLITWYSKLTAAKEVKQLNLFTKKAYAGLGLRLPKSMDGKAEFTFLNEVKSTPVRNTERVTWAGGVACTGPVNDDRTVTVAMLSYPPHCSHITHWFTMSDSLTYMTATMNLYRQPIVLREGNSLDIKHAVAVWDGAVTEKQLRAASLAWRKTVEPPARPGWAETHVNLATSYGGASATASSVFGEGYEAAKAIDGKWAARETDKWNSAANITPHFLKVDLGKERTIDRIRIVHEGLLPGGEPCTTAGFRLQASLRQWGPFEDLTPPIRDNTDAISEHVFEPRDARYVRLLIETGEQNGVNTYGRIFELEVYGPIGGTTPKEEE